jgi:hypothetical protein
MVDHGDSEEHDQIVSIGATWETNPTLTEEDTRKLEPEKLKHDREYGSIPTDAGSHPWFEAESVDTAQIDAPAVCLPKGHNISIACIDTGFRRDASGIVILHWEGTKLRVGEILEIKREPNDPPLVPSVVLTKFAELCTKHNVLAVGADQHYIETAREYLAPFNMVELPGGATGKVDVHTVARDVLREGNAEIQREHKDLTRQLKQVGHKLTTGGNCTISSPRREGQHGDIASAYCGAVWLAITNGTSDTTVIEQTSDPITNDSRWGSDFSQQGYG